MKAKLTIVLCVLAIGAILYLALNPQTGVVYGHPGVAAAFLLIGLGLTKDARERVLARAKAKA